MRQKLTPSLLILLGLAFLALPVAVRQATAASGGTSNSAVLPARVHTVSDLLERAKEIKFEGLTFKIASSSNAFLSDLAAALLRDPAARLEIASHTPDNGDAKKDLALSKRRADAIKEALVSQGVAADRLFARGYGSQNPVAPNISRTGRQHNDRVELHRVGVNKASIAK
jgi:outer membrane protein OmpA-like peptidoglycan-associated protein